MSYGVGVPAGNGTTAQALHRARAKALRVFPPLAPQEPAARPRRRGVTAGLCAIGRGRILQLVRRLIR
ncbi:hypothetical protein C8J29_10494 [Cereibacter johrii]|uniref:Uncharacterized protein n=1 Tax=Cereibacter johrii TaxID=445629 RepID=A0ABX5J5E6_9RHOB|nr:hypothetical protein C8J29_10494 [Cereibacter johrii]